MCLPIKSAINKQGRDCRIGTSHLADAPTEMVAVDHDDNDRTRAIMLSRDNECDRPLGSKTQLLLSVVEVAKILSLSRTKIYELLYAGQLPSVKIGAARRVRMADLENFVSSLEVAV